MYAIIDRLTEVLSQGPDPVLASGSIGTKIPSGTSDLPAVVSAIQVDHGKGIGVGRFVRSGNVRASITTDISVQPSNTQFSSDFRRLQLISLPLRKNPSSAQAEGFSAADFRIEDTTNPGSPIPYRMVETPNELYEFKLDVPRAEVTFGQPQAQGSRLSVTHWTVTWRDDILAFRYSGLMTLTVWAPTFVDTDAIARRLQSKLETAHEFVREKGFVTLQAASLKPASHEITPSLVGSPFTVWKQQLGYRFTFETEEGGALSSGGRIERIDMDFTGEISESFHVPHSTN